MPKDDKNELYTIDRVEVFAVGKWNGYKFTKEDLVAMANAFSNLREFLAVPLKLGHNDEQPLKDGDFALGWVEDLWVDADEQGRDKLFAKLVDMPEIVYNAVKKRRYRKVSIELDFGVEHKGRYYTYALTGIALLGAQLPAVSTLNDIAHYMDRAEPMHASQHATFSLQTSNGVIQQEEGTFMPLSEQEERELREQLRKALNESATYSQQAADEKAAREKAEQERKEFERKEQERKEQEKADKVKYNRDQITAKFEKAVKDMVLTPAQRDSFTKLLSVEDDEAMYKADLEAVDKLIEDNSMDGKNFSRDTGNGGSGGGKDEEYSDAGEFLHEKTLEYQAKHENMTYARAQERVFQMHRKVAMEHVNATTEQREEA